MLWIFGLMSLGTVAALVSVAVACRPLASSV